MNDFVLQGIITAMESGWIPDAWIRAGIRHLCGRRLARLASDAGEAMASADRTGNLERSSGTPSSFLATLDQAEIAPLPDHANEQHYEVPAEFFELMLGPRRKYSCGYWPNAQASLAEAEDESLRRTCQHAQIEDGMSVLELGGGWGSLSLWIVEHYPKTTITAVSNSHSQKAFIDDQARQRGWHDRLTVVTADMNQFRHPQRVDRIISVEMFEHMRNYRELLRRAATWLKPQGEMLIHIFCHRQWAYPFEARGAANWMGRYFFSGGMMPSANVFDRFADDLAVREEWTWNGRHYERTLEAWLARLDESASEARRVLSRVYGDAQAAIWLRRWRIFLMACAELFGYRHGDEWFVRHFRLTHAAPRPLRPSSPADPIPIL